MSKLTQVFWMMLASLVSASALAGDVAVKWQDPAKYTDIDPADTAKAQFEDKLFKDFNAIFSELAKKLPDNVHWEVTVTDLDLAGYVKSSAATGGRAMRVIKSDGRPAISFEYRLLDSDGKQIAQSKVDLKDPNFMSRSSTVIGLNVKPFPYEEFMINQWFSQQQTQKIFPSR